MNFDRNTIIGFIALAILFIGYFFYTTKEQNAALAYKRQQDSIAMANQAPLRTPQGIPDTTAGTNPNTTAGQILPIQQANEETSILENEVLRITFTNKGGQPKTVELKKYKGPDSSLVKLASTEYDRIDYPLISGPNQTVRIADLYFNSQGLVKNADGSQTITYNLSTEGGGSVVHQFVLKPDDYMVDFNLQVNGAQQLLGGDQVNLSWQNRALQLQKDLEYEKQQSQIGYRVDGDFSDKSISSKGSKTFDEPVEWVSVKQQFFNTTLLAKNHFTSGRMEWNVPSGDTTIVQAASHLKLQLPEQGAASLGIYYGPNDYNMLKRYGNDMEDLVNLGSGVFAFVKYINRWIVIPVFNFLSTIFSNYGIVILFLTLFIRLLTSPLMYPGYLTSAKMKVLKPELAELKKKYPDQQQYAMEQMKFMREAGVNQFAGCLPGLLQIPIFFALYSFFNANVALRGKSFLWAEDLSQYDSILNFGFNIPLLGDHLSLFTVTAAVTSLLISVYSMNMSGDQSNPVLKYMPYFFPIILLFIFNSLPSALTWYYTVSNIITLIIQFVILRFIIDHDKLLAQIQENRKKPKTKSKWQERMEQMQEQQKKMQEMQKKGRAR